MAGWTKRERRRAEMLRSKEDLWDRGLSHAVWHARSSEYNALYDGNMRHFFENEQLQSHLYQMGLIDSVGRVLNLDRNKSKLNVIKREFNEAEKNEYWRQKEEEEMRERVQKKRFEALERAKRVERILRIREDCKIRTEIVAALRHTHAPAVNNNRSRERSIRTAPGSLTA